MAREWATLRRFRTKRFVVALHWEEEQAPDLSWADEETLAKIKAGEYGVYDFRVTVYLDGEPVGRTYLGNSIYADPHEFAREHRNGKGAYFPDMLKEAVHEARSTLLFKQRHLPKLRASAVKEPSLYAFAEGQAE